MPADKKNLKSMDLERDIEEVARPKKNESRQEIILPSQGSSFGKIAFTFIGLAIILIIAVFYISYLNTTLVVTPNIQPIETNFEAQVVLLDKIKAETGDLGDVQKMIEKWSKVNNDKVAGEAIEETIEQEKSFAVTSEGGEKKSGIAHGKITIFNKQSTAQDLIAKTRFQAESGAIFRIKTSVTVPANGETEAEVFADKEGEKGDVGPTKFILPGFSSEEKRKLVYAESSEAMTGGLASEKVLGQEDINRAKQELQTILYNEALVKLDAQLKQATGETPAEQKLPAEGAEGTGAKNLDEEVKLLKQYKAILPNATTQEVSEVKITPEIGTKTDNFTLKMKLKVTALLFDEESLLALAKIKLQDSVTEGKKLTTANDDSLKYSLKSYEADLGTATLETSIAGEGYITSAEVLGKLSLDSLEPEAIQAYLEAHPEIANIEIKEAPIWMRKLPILKDRVKVKVEMPVE